MPETTQAGVRRLFKQNGLSSAAFALFALSLAGHAATGFAVECEEALEHQEAAPTFGAYLSSGSFVESV